jgi:hypothetical protein
MEVTHTETNRGNMGRHIYILSKAEMLYTIAALKRTAKLQ